MTGETTGVMVDSSVILDVLTEAPRWFSGSSAALSDAAEDPTLVINAVIDAESSVRFDRIEDLEAALAGASIGRRHAPCEAAFLAAKRFLRYRSGGGTRTTALPDFLIGAHAAVEGWTILTRDAVRSRTYLPRRSVIPME